ncbi:AAA family ATPase [Allonocardiopsis opalescens]|uniref:MinD-like ATPase involved in chromosome partitioning or flagellar assembly n=1 Tax=Allonocardiopsis opalescens TaxID=1144618 RepID=A0A2T0Q743_9ACTN|nr:AAA family ATPase [Allonocardiopsis opalescens]PRX99649.1 MinD-like ATPase involved in chromosome partitioning or flagellar assembly [Allonocardiopsis opalescens]
MAHRDPDDSYDGDARSPLEDQLAGLDAAEAGERGDASARPSSGAAAEPYPPGQWFGPAPDAESGEAEGPAAGAPPQYATPYPPADDSAQAEPFPPNEPPELPPAGVEPDQTTINVRPPHSPYPSEQPRFEDGPQSHDESDDPDALESGPMTEVIPRYGQGGPRQPGWAPTFNPYGEPPAADAETVRVNGSNPPAPEARPDESRPAERPPADGGANPAGHQPPPASPHTSGYQPAAGPRPGGWGEQPPAHGRPPASGGYAIPGPQYNHPGTEAGPGGYAPPQPQYGTEAPPAGYPPQHPYGAGHEPGAEGSPAGYAQPQYGADPGAESGGHPGAQGHTGPQGVGPDVPAPAAGHGYQQPYAPPYGYQPGQPPPGYGPDAYAGQIPPGAHPGQMQHENVDSLRAENLLRGRKQAPTAGWRRMLYKSTFGLVDPGESPNELRRREQLARIRTPVAGGHHRVAVLSLKGGVGKTTTTVGLGATLASLRGDRVLAVDGNPDRGTLSDKVQLESNATIRDLLNDRAQIQRYADVRAYTSQAPSRLEILASDSDPAISEAFSRDDYLHVASLLEHYYSICITDCGTGLLHSAMSGVLELADQIVLVSSPSVDGARSASATLDWLEAHEHGDLVAQAVVVLSMVRPKSRSSVDLDRLEQHFLGRTRAVVRIPHDSHLEEGAEVDLDELSKETLESYLQLAAVVGDAFARPRTANPHSPRH